MNERKSVSPENFPIDEANSTGKMQVKYIPCNIKSINLGRIYILHLQKIQANTFYVKNL